MSSFYSNNKSSKKRPKYRISFLAISFVLILGVCFAIYMRSADLDIKAYDETQSSSTTEETDESSDVTQSSEDSQQSSSETTEETQEIPSDNDDNGVNNPVALSDSVGMEYFKSCLFIGDSVSLGLSTYQKLEPQNVFASKGMNISKVNTEKLVKDIGVYYVDKTALEAVEEAKPENIYIMLGSNGIAWLSNEYMIGKYSEFIDNLKQISPDSNIYILSIPPVTEGRENFAKEDGPIQNSDIDSYNSELLKMANDKEVYFVDLNTALKNNEGKLDTDMAQKDGLHFQSSTYDIMLEYIMTHVAK